MDQPHQSAEGGDGEGSAPDKAKGSEHMNPGCMVENQKGKRRNRSHGANHQSPEDTLDPFVDPLIFTDHIAEEGNHFVSFQSVRPMIGTYNFRTIFV